MHIWGVASLLAYSLLLVQAATIPTIQSRDTNTTTAPNNDTDNVSVIPWPPPPFRVPNGPSLGPPFTQGVLDFDIVGSRADRDQRWAFDSLVLLITNLPSGRLWKPSVVVVEYDQVVPIHSFFFDLRLFLPPKAPFGHPRPRQADMNTMLLTVSQQVARHGLNELQLNLVDHPYYQGGMQLLLESTKSIPRDPTIFLLVPTEDYQSNPTRYMVEITAYTWAAEELPQILSCLIDAAVDIAHRPASDPYSGQRIITVPYIFSMRRDRGTDFTNAIAKAVVRTISKFTINLKSTLEFRVWIKGAEGPSVLVGGGYLRKMTTGGIGANGTELVGGGTGGNGTTEGGIGDGEGAGYELPNAGISDGNVATS